MTAKAIGGVVIVPSPPTAMSGADTNITLDATTDYAAFVLKVPATGTIDKIHIRVGATAQTGGNATLSCQVQTLDAAGDPSGTAYGSSATATYSVTGTDDNTFVTFNSLACSATINDYIAIRVWLSAIVTTASVNVTYGVPWNTNPNQGLPYLTSRTTGTGAGTHVGCTGGVTVEYSGAVYYETGLVPAATYATDAIDNDSTVRRVGNILTLAVPCTCVGIWAVIDNDFDTTSLVLYDSDGTTELGTVTLTAVNRNAGTPQVYYGWFEPVSLSAGTTYRAAAKTTSTTANAGVMRTFTTVAEHMGQMSLGTNCYFTSHNGTVWSENTAKRTSIGLLISKFDDGNGLGRASYNLGGLA